MSGLTGRVAVVTGGSGVIGGAVCRLLAAEGATVAVASRSLERARSSIATHGGEGRLVPCSFDLADAASVTRAIDELAHQIGTPSILVAAASSRETLPSGGRRPAAADFAALFSIDVAGHHELARAIADRLPRDAQASLVFLSSVYARVGVDPRIYPDGMSGTPAHYSAVKAGVEGLVRHLAAEWGGRGIRVNAVVAGAVRNPARQDEEFVRRYSAKTMLGRLASADEIASAVLFLVSDASSYITGSSLVVDGGMTAW